MPTATKIETYIQVVDVDTATEWLGYNTHNRVASNAHVAALAGAILRGEWKLDGSAIRFSESGVLLDGQHRLLALIEANKIAKENGERKKYTIETLVIEGLPDEVQDTIDRGKGRNLKDALSLRGHANASTLAALTTYWWRYEAGYVRVIGMKPTIPQAIATLEEHPGLVDMIPWANRILGRFRMSAAMLGSCLYEFSSIDQDATIAFVDKLQSGVGLKEGDAILALRRWLERQQNAGVGSRASALATHALFIKAWNAWRDGVKVGQLNWKASGMKAEQFPEPH